MASVTIASVGLSDASGTKQLNVTINTYAATPIDAVTYSSFPGAQSNTITIPAGATGCLIVPPAGSAVSLTLKGIAGDTGISIGAGVPSLITFNSATPASFVLTSGGAISGAVICSFF